MFKSLLFALTILSVSVVSHTQRTYKVASPDNTLKVSVSVSDDMDSDHLAEQLNKLIAKAKE